MKMLHVCPICQLLFPTKQEKEWHLRLHCVTCNALCASRRELLDHMQDSHDVVLRNKRREALSGAGFWSSVARRPVEDDGATSENWVDLIDYLCAHTD